MLSWLHNGCRNVDAIPLCRFYRKNAKTRKPPVYLSCDTLSCIMIFFMRNLIFLAFSYRFETLRKLIIQYKIIIKIARIIYISFHVFASNK